jgi:hypothetical protein
MAGSRLIRHMNAVEKQTEVEEIRERLAKVEAALAELVRKMERMELRKSLWGR